MDLRENKSCYAGPDQRKVLVSLARAPLFSRDFFLTGGTALSVWYLHHRRSNDLDFFTTSEIDLNDIDMLIRTEFPHSFSSLIQAPSMRSYLVHDVKIDIVVDQLSLHEERPVVEMETSVHLKLDTIRNIASNKLTALVSRNEPKDIIDFYYLMAEDFETKIERTYRDALSKDAIFEDPPTVAFQVEENMRLFIETPELMPEMIRPVDIEKIRGFYDKLTRWIYSRLTTS